MDYKRLLIIFVFIAFLLPINLFADTYYVDPACDNADTDYDGTTQTCDAGSDTVYTSLANALAGDVTTDDAISFSDGNYAIPATSIDISISLTSISQDNTKVSLYPASDLGSSFLLTFSSTAGSADQTNNNATISYLEITGLNGVNEYAENGIKIQNRNGFTIDHCNIHDFVGGGSERGYAVYVYGSDAGSTEWWESWPVDIQVPGTDTTLDSFWPDNPVLNFTFTNNTLSNNGWKGVGNLLTPTIRIKNLRAASIHDNTVSSSYGSIIGQAEAWLYDCDIYNNDLTMDKFDDRSSYAIEVWCTRNDCKFYSNTSNAAFSISYGKETSIYSNDIIVTDGKGGIGIEFANQRYGIVRDNFLSGTSYGIKIGASQDNTGIGAPIITDIIIRNNVVYGVTKDALYIQIEDYAHLNNVFVYNNTLNINSNAVYPLLYIEQSDTGGTSYMDNINLLNMILTNGAGDNGVVSDTGHITNLTIDYGDSYGGGSSNEIDGSETSYISVDPNYADSSFDEFNDSRPQESQVIDAGRYITLVDDSEGGTGTAMKVDDNMEGAFYPNDYVFVNNSVSADFFAQISSINRTTHVLNLTESKTWDDNAEVYHAISATVSYYGSEIDMGGYEVDLAVTSVSPVDGSTGVNITASATWDYPAFVDDADIWLDKNDCDNVECDGSLVSDDDADKSYDMSTLDESSTYCLGIKANDGASQGSCQEYEFTTTDVIPPTTSLGGIDSTEGCTNCVEIITGESCTNCVEIVVGE